MNKYFEAKSGMYKRVTYWTLLCWLIYADSVA